MTDSLRDMTGRGRTIHDDADPNEAMIALSKMAGQVEVLTPPGGIGGLLELTEQAGRTMRRLRDEDDHHDCDAVYLAGKVLQRQVGRWLAEFSSLHQKPEED